MKRNFIQIFMTGAFGALSIAAAVAVFSGRAEWLPWMFLMIGGAHASWTETEEER